jgi:hypothetical protein
VKPFPILSCLLLAAFTWVTRGAEQTIGQWQIAEREVDSQVWHSTALEFDTVTHKWVQRQKRFFEVATGLNYHDQNGAWQATREELHPGPDGSAVGEFGPHRLVVANNLNSDSFIDFTGSDGVRLRSGPVAIGYYDPVDGRNVILATVQDRAGQPSRLNRMEARSSSPGTIADAIPRATR